jgi:hypothetical protein
MFVTTVSKVPECALDLLDLYLVADMSIYGQLSTLDGLLDLSQYRLIRGLLAFNLGEDTERVLPSVNPPPFNADVS